jgi:hypothetical protein
MLDLSCFILYFVALFGVIVKTKRISILSFFNRFNGGGKHIPQKNLSINFYFTFFLTFFVTTLNAKIVKLACHAIRTS